MSDSNLDFAILGSSPFAALLAISLASLHGKKVCLVAQPINQFQLVRSVSLSVAPVTRPETWALLQSTKGELESLLAKVPGTFFSRSQSAFVSQTIDGTNALGHIRHMAAGYGFATAALTTQNHLGFEEGFTFESALRLRHRPFFNALPSILTQLGIQFLPQKETTLKVKRTSTTLDFKDIQLTANRVVATDSISLGQSLPNEKQNQICKRSAFTSILTEPGTTLPFPTIVDIDTGAFGYTHPDGRVECIVRGDGEIAKNWLANMLPEHSSTYFSGLTEFTEIENLKGIPIVGQVGNTHTSLALLPAPTAPFLAPSVARQLCNTTSPFETDYFAGRNLDIDKQHVTDFVGSGFGV